MAKIRLDLALVENGFAESREKAKALIMAGIVYVNNQKSDKAGNMLKPDDIIEVRGETLKYVSRGGLKLEKAVEVFDFSLQNTICADIGASTGGFTDCMLQNGAKKVYAIDVGYGQLAWKLRTDERVVNLERTNFRYVTNKEIPEELDFASVDVSFISLSLILPVMRTLLKDSGQAVCLIKPQFEAGKENVGKKGVVRDKKVHIAVIEKIIELLKENNFTLLGLDFSPVKGPEGNIEYLCHIKKTDAYEILTEVTATQVVENSYKALQE
ncbi:MAG: TlyA family RNA methyltransferase [Clostridia bacterium]|nr:TlyA family RNA methyltransferase [Clostridia bacterium]